MRDLDLEARWRGFGAGEALMPSQIGLFYWAAWLWWIAHPHEMARTPEPDFSKNVSSVF